MGKDIYGGLKRIIKLEDRITRLTESVKLSNAALQNHAERFARREGKFELLEHTLTSPWRSLSG